MRGPHVSQQSGNCRIINAETLLASLEAAGIENARIEIEAKEDGSSPLEVPCPDGSASVWTDFIKFAGVRYAPSQDGKEHVPKKRIIPQKVRIHLLTATSAYLSEITHTPNRN